MTKATRPSNPLALAVLVLLFERPMHPYEMAATLKERHKEESIKLRYGSLYTVIELLLRRRYIVAKETVREGRRPERTVYMLTPLGEVEMREWLSDLLSNPAKEYPQFEAALSLLPALTPARAAELLEARIVRLDREIERVRAGLASAAGQVPRLFLIEAEFYIATLEAERGFVAALTREITDETLDGVRFWKEFHAARQAGAETPPALERKA
ncbi:MAG TPA: helix-turn-helix transcriptional regulator [Xanthobacteraceae bacterium]|nr:helix-turn-helix transcriptional regulator [Xanthobacteraceae bacterium]